MNHSDLQRRPRASRWLLACALVVGLVVAPFSASAAMADIQLGDTVWIGPAEGYSGSSFFPIYENTPDDLANPGPPD